MPARSPFCHQQQGPSLPGTDLGAHPGPHRLSRLRKGWRASPERPRSTRSHHTPPRKREAAASPRSTRSCRSRKRNAGGWAVRGRRPAPAAAAPAARAPGARPPRRPPHLPPGGWRRPPCRKGRRRHRHWRGPARCGRRPSPRRRCAGRPRRPAAWAQTSRCPRGSARSPRGPGPRTRRPARRQRRRGGGRRARGGAWPASPRGCAPRPGRAGGAALRSWPLPVGCRW
mmetsp:Transcript_2191/g.6189  ORF Transcript_2191/g.6189 Transcript_2191/m.6189 type:complete len:228 (-) Transcript_2191:789-1472(-)